LQRGGRKQWQWGENGTSEGDRLGDEGELGQQKRHNDPLPFRLTQLIVDGAESDFRQLRDDQVRADGDQHHKQDIANGHPAQGGDGRQVSTRRCRGLGTQLLEAELMVTGEITKVGSQRSSLQVGQRRGDAVSADGVERCGESPLGAYRDARRDQQLGRVNVQHR